MPAAEAPVVVQCIANNSDAFYTGTVTEEFEGVGIARADCPVIEKDTGGALAIVIASG